MPLFLALSSQGTAFLVEAADKQRADSIVNTVSDPMTYEFEKDSTIPIAGQIRVTVEDNLL
jgi:hypothetical protein